MMGYEKPKHPLITILDASRLLVTKEMIGKKYDLIYSILL